MPTKKPAASAASKAAAEGATAAKKKKPAAAAAAATTSAAAEAVTKKKPTKAAAKKETTAAAAPAGTSAEKKPAAKKGTAKKEGEGKKKKATKKAAAGGGEGAKKKTTKKKATKTKPAEKAPESTEEEEDEYENDFEEEETYDEDFEEEEEEEEEKKKKKAEATASPTPAVVPKIDAKGAATSGLDVRAAAQQVEEENGRIARAKAQQQRQPQILLPERRVVDLATSTAISATQQRIVRGRELQRIVQLDRTRVHELLDIPPMSQYDVYMQRFGRSGDRQVWTQTGFDDLSVAAETDPPETRSRAVQFPDPGASSLLEAILEEQELVRASTGGDGDDTASPEEVVARISAKLAMATASERLPRFLSRASRVVELLLDEASAAAAGMQSTFPVSAKWAASLRRFTAPSFLLNREAVDVRFSETLDYAFVAVYGPVSGSAGFMKERGFACIWHMQDSEHPAHVLVCDGQLTTACFAGDSPFLVAGGTDGGALVLWDTREPESAHERTRIGQNPLLLRRPTFSTDAQRRETHFAPILTVLSAGESSRFVVADDSSVVTTWLAVHVGSQSGQQQQQQQAEVATPGLSPIGKTCLIRSGLFNATEAFLPTKTLDMCTSQGEADEFYLLATDTGDVVRSSLLAGAGQSSERLLFPKRYPASISGEQATCLATNRLVPHFFLAGYSDGSVRLFSTDSDMALHEWRGFGTGSITQLLWSPERACLFLAFDSASSMHIFDLALKTTGPALSETFAKMGVSTGDMVTAASLSRQSLLVARASGTVDLFVLAKQLATAPADDTARFSEFALVV